MKIKQRRLVGVRLLDGTWIKISNKAKKDNRTISQVVRIALEKVFGR